MFLLNKKDKLKDERVDWKCLENLNFILLFTNLQILCTISSSCYLEIEIAWMKFSWYGGLVVWSNEIENVSFTLYKIHE